MRLKKSPENISMINFDEFVEKSNSGKKRRHSPLLPDHCRGLISGPSGSGKTNVMINLLIHSNGLKFRNLYVYSNSLFQPKFQLIKKILAPLRSVKCFFYKNQKNIVQPREAEKNSIFIFDDVICNDQKLMTSYFAMGSHRDIDVFYLSQSYIKVPKALIRDNVNLLILFKQDEINLKHVFEEHVSSDMQFNQFKKMCNYCWLKRHDFLVINKDCDVNAGRYRKGFDTIITSFK